MNTGPGTIKIIQFDSGRVMCRIDTTPTQWVTILKHNGKEFVRVLDSNYQIKGNTAYRMEK